MLTRCPFTTWQQQRFPTVTCGSGLESARYIGVHRLPFMIWTDTKRSRLTSGGCRYPKRVLQGSMLFPFPTFCLQRDSRSPQDMQWDKHFSQELELGIYLTLQDWDPLLGKEDWFPSLPTACFTSFTEWGKKKRINTCVLLYSHVFWVYLYNPCEIMLSM